MRVINILYLFFCLGLYCVFHALYVSSLIPYAFINVCLLFTALPACSYSNRSSLALIALSWLFLYPASLLYYRIDHLNAALPVFVFSCLQLGALSHRYITKRETALRDAGLSERDAVRKRAAEECELLRRTEDGVRDRELATVGLYEITKKMSESLRIDDIFKVFSGFLNENFVFRRCELLILDAGEAAPPCPGRIYSASSPTAESVRQEKIDYDKLINLLSGRPQKIYVSKADDGQLFGELRLDQEKTETFMAMPLLDAKKLVAALVVENLPKTDMERFDILSMELALEIRKALLYETVERLAITDSLTGLYVRRYFLERLAEESKRAKRHGLGFSFLMIDIDDFKRTNDSYGHLVGDVILKEMGRMMRDSVREMDLISRYGGEEFAICLPETPKDAAALIAERIRKRIEDNTFRAYDESLKLMVSIGVSAYPEDSAVAADIIGNADAALYAAKRSGKNVVSVYKK